MRIGLIAMSGVRVRNAELAKLGVTLPQFVSRGKVIASLPSLGLLTVAALTPDDCDVVYREIGDLDSADPLEPFDLVGISSFTAQIDDAYALADRYRAAGVPVVLGGLHVSLMPDEAAAHADSIVLYGAEGAWPQLVRDFQAGRLQPTLRRSPRARLRVAALRGAALRPAGRPSVQPRDGADVARLSAQL